MEICWYKSVARTVEQCGGKVRWNSAGGRAWWNRGTVLVEQWNSVGGTVLVEQCGGTVEQ